MDLISELDFCDDIQILIRLSTTLAKASYHQVPRHGF